MTQISSRYHLYTLLSMVHRTVQNSPTHISHIFAPKSHLSDVLQSQPLWNCVFHWATQLVLYAHYLSQHFHSFCCWNIKRYIINNCSGFQGTSSTVTECMASVKISQRKKICSAASLFSFTHYKECVKTYKGKERGWCYWCGGWGELK